MIDYRNLDDVISQMRAAGLVLESVKNGQGGSLVGPVYVEATKSVRCDTLDRPNKRSGAYRLHELRLNDGIWLAGAYWLDHGNAYHKIELNKECAECGASMPLKLRACPVCGSTKRPKSREVPKEELERHRQRMLQNMRQAKADESIRHDRAAQWASTIWRASTPATLQSHDYFGRKGLTETYGARIYPGNDGIMLEGAEEEDYRRLSRYQGALVVPLQDLDGKVWALQFILSREQHGELIRKLETDKMFWPAGANTDGMLYVLGGSPQGLGLVCEGFATGGSLRQGTGLSVVLAWNAGNVPKVAARLKKRHRHARLLICADDDWIQTCLPCGKYTPVASDTCVHCGQPHGKGNAGVRYAREAAAVDDVAWMVPVFAQHRPDNRKGPTDFNDLAALEGIETVRRQVEDKLAAIGWDRAAAPILARGLLPQGGGDEGGAMPSRISIDEAAGRYWGTYGLGGDVLFDEVERRLVHKKDVVNLLPRHGWDALKDHPDWRVARDWEVGFDPTEADPAIRCNLFGGWPTEPRAGACVRLLELLEYLCMNEPNAGDIYRWILKWLAYPLQHRGAKMHSAIVVHGPQGTGKSRFFEAYARIFGPYGRVLGQEALEDKFNADWAEKKLFILADEVLARQDMYHIKNRLKGFITGDTIRVNPKNVAAHNEKNQMNIVFLSNERQPLVLENDDRRHCVIWVPPKLPDVFFAEVNAEIDAGGIAALHHHLLELGLGDFRPWTKPPMTRAKQDLIDLGTSSEERFLRDWTRGDAENGKGDALPFCPCTGSQLYIAYERWCEAHGERKRGRKDLISLAGKQPGWRAGEAVPTWSTLLDRDIKNRKMVIPADPDLQIAGSHPDALRRDRYTSQAEWLAACFFAFEEALGVAP